MLHFNCHALFVDNPIWCRQPFLSGLTLVDPLVEHATGRENCQLGLVLLEHFLIILGDTRNLVDVLPGEYSQASNRQQNNTAMMKRYRSYFSYLYICVWAVACDFPCCAGVHSWKLLIVDLSVTIDIKGWEQKNQARSIHVKDRKIARCGYLPRRLH